MFLPLALASLGLVCSIIGIIFVKLSSNKSPESALRMGTIGSAVLFIVTSYFLINSLDVSNNIWAAVLMGSIGELLSALSLNTIQLESLSEISQKQGKLVLLQS